MGMPLPSIHLNVSLTYLLTKLLLIVWQKVTECGHRCIHILQRSVHAVFPVVVGWSVYRGCAPPEKILGVLFMKMVHSGTFFVLM